MRKSKAKRHSPNRNHKSNAIEALIIDVCSTLDVLITPLILKRNLNRNDSPIRPNHRLMPSLLKLVLQLIRFAQLFVARLVSTVVSHVLGHPLVHLQVKLRGAHEERCRLKLRQAALPPPRSHSVDCASRLQGVGPMCSKSCTVVLPPRLDPVLIREAHVAATSLLQRICTFSVAHASLVATASLTQQPTPL